MNEKRWIKASVKKRTFDNGGEVLKMSVLLSDLLKCPVNNKGYVYIEIASKRDGKDEYGRTHNVSLDAYDPNDERRENKDMIKMAEFLDGERSELHLGAGLGDDGEPLPF